jgi:hypothetical protein
MRRPVERQYGNDNITATVGGTVVFIKLASPQLPDDINTETGHRRWISFAS